MSSYSSHRRGSRNPFASRTPFPTTDLPSDRNLKAGLKSTALKTLSRPATTSTVASTAPLQLKNVAYIGSYNWTGADKPTIIVPGAPREWVGRSTPFRVQADTGTQFVDQHGYRIEKTPLLSLFRAVDALASDGQVAHLEWPMFDFVTDRNNLRKLMRWLNGADDAEIKDFRIDLQLGGKRTVLMNRWEKRFKEDMSGLTFGFNFEKATTKLVQGCEGSTGHHRIVRYDMDGMSFVVRFAVDACSPRPEPKATTSTLEAARTSSSLDDISDLLSGLKVSPEFTQATSTATAASTPATTPDIVIVHGGYQVPQGSIMELTTRSERNAQNMEWNEYYPQLFLSQTAQHVLGVHQKELSMSTLFSGPAILHDVTVPRRGGYKAPSRNAALRLTLDVAFDAKDIDRGPPDTDETDDAEEEEDVTDSDTTSDPDLTRRFKLGSNDLVLSDANGKLSCDSLTAMLRVRKQAGIPLRKLGVYHSFGLQKQERLRWQSYVGELDIRLQAENDGDVARTVVPSETFIS
ncbi:hypothetical protein EIP91_000813 [Steccherinum ochraceum]|uniref:Uncharacterized protein n=1 Tax=Steccherinum ochraceum TaxID=92696 RepID=A0A4R0RNL8_9APHY|nr:hypothetical protein EIP91_000813 [Steccherinum ochraceum]